MELMQMRDIKLLTGGPQVGVGPAAWKSHLLDANFLACLVFL